MQALKCKMCGGNEFTKNGEFYICKFCGTMADEYDQRVKVTHDDGNSYEDLLKRGSTFLKLKNYNNALETFKKMGDLYPDKYKVYTGTIKALTHGLTHMHYSDFSSAGLKLKTVRKQIDANLKNIETVAQPDEKQQVADFFKEVDDYKEYLNKIGQIEEKLARLKEINETLLGNQDALKAPKTEVEQKISALNALKRQLAELERGYEAVRRKHRIKLIISGVIGVVLAIVLWIFKAGFVGGLIGGVGFFGIAFGALSVIKPSRPDVSTVGNTTEPVKKEDVDNMKRKIAAAEAELKPFQQEVDKYNRNNGDLTKEKEEIEAEIAVLEAQL